MPTMHPQHCATRAQRKRARACVWRARVCTFYDVEGITSERCTRARRATTTTVTSGRARAESKRGALISLHFSCFDLHHHHHIKDRCLARRHHSTLALLRAQRTARLSVYAAARQKRTRIYSCPQRVPRLSDRLQAASDHLINSTLFTYIVANLEQAGLCLLSSRSAGPVGSHNTHHGSTRTTSRRRSGCWSSSRATSSTSASSAGPSP